MSDDQKREMITKLRKANAEYFNNPNNRLRHSQQAKEIWNNRSDEFKENRRKFLMTIGEKFRSDPKNIERLSKLIKSYYKDPLNRELQSISQSKSWDRLSDEERSKRMSHLINYWETITPKKLDDYFKARALGILENASYKIGCTEYQFSKYLQNIDMSEYTDYRFGYVNENKHADFDKLFPKNPITGGNLSPYHIWDFLIYTKIGNIIVDIDGKIHGGKSTQYDVTYNYGNRVTVKLSEITSLYDSLRLYQTDGYLAYLVKAYDNNISDITLVQNLKTNNIISLKEFVSYLKSIKND